MTIKYNKVSEWQENLPNGHNIYQQLNCKKPTKIYQNCDFWFENKPSGNPESSLVQQTQHWLLSDFFQCEKERKECIKASEKHAG
jgi:hypothetical protein